MIEKVEEKIEKAKILIRDRNFNEAKILLNQLISKYPEHAACYKARASLHYSINDIQKAFEDLDIALSLEPEEPAFWFFKGYWKINLNLFEEGEEALTQAIIEENKLNSSYYLGTCFFMRAYARQQIGKKKDALLDLDKVGQEMQIYLNGKIRSVSTIREEIREI